MKLPEEYRRHLRSGGVAIWAVVGAPVVITGLESPTANGGWRALVAWVAVFLFFGATFRGATRARGESNRAASLAMVAGQSVAALVLLALPPCFGLEAALLVLVALELGAFLSRRAAVTWIAAQSAGFAAITWAQWGWHWAVVLAFAYSSFQWIADATTRLFIESAAARARLTALNAELEATRELLAQGTRNDERARIARDLHDVLGHHLIASHLTRGDAMARVETAQSVTRLLLGDVRAVVGELRQSTNLDIAAALAKLAAGIPRPRIHIEVAPGVAIDDPVAGEVVLRCAQEIVTNTVRHAQAENGTAVRPVVSQRVVRGLGASESRFPHLDPPDPLTDREVDVLRLMTGGYSNREIGRALNVAEGTVKNHVSSILSKLGVRDRTRAVLQAVKAGYFS